MYCHWSNYVRQLLIFSCSQLGLIFQIPWLRPKTISTTRTPQTVPFHKYLTYLTSLLTTSVSSMPNRLLCFMSSAYSFTTHLRNLYSSIIYYHVYYLRILQKFYLWHVSYVNIRHNIAILLFDILDSFFLRSVELLLFISFHICRHIPYRDSVQ